ncbi:ABC transporter permease [Actinocatenispora rupis]|uniref:ABC transporter permease n=1 Tax=Actinocatenispora rupis TaxID=519421 RepID=A0A8J3N8X4_9ACTN|nr:ABC transporter permease [Actinocatenispora rupis]GID10759.1 ABC transporter permease [Actinocatenispora rupis]
MNGNAIPLGPTLAAVLVALALLAATVAALGRLGVGRRVLTASVRAALQLTAVSLVIAAVLRSLALTALFVALMYSVASVTSARRITRSRTGLWAAVPIAAGLVPALALILGSGLVPLTGIAIVPIAGILIGGAMTATSLSGRRALDELATRHGEYEAALALGFSRRAAVLEVCRPSAAQALVPALDQTRTVGLVTLPGAFVGVLLGGASPLAAGAAQLLVLIALLAVESVAVLVAVELVAAGRLTRRADGR